MPDSNLADNAVLTSAFYNTYIREQVVITCTSTTRPTPVTGQLISESDTGRVARYDGSAWQYIDASTWTTFTPSWVAGITVGNGTYSGCQYRYVGKSIQVVGSFTLGSTSAVTGSVLQSVPGSASIASGSVLLGSSRLIDNGTATFLSPMQAFSATSVGFYVLGASGTYATPLTLSASVPFTWTTSDSISWSYAAPLA